MMWESKNPPCRVGHHVGSRPQAYDVVLRVTGYTLGTVTKRTQACLVPGAEDVVRAVRSVIFSA
jgi:hypothetical protein